MAPADLASDLGAPARLPVSARWQRGWPGLPFAPISHPVLPQLRMGGWWVNLGAILCGSVHPAYGRWQHRAPPQLGGGWVA